MKIYHIYLPLLMFILLLPSCAVDPSGEQNALVPTKDTFRQEDQQRQILYDRALQQLEETHPEAYEIYQQARAVESERKLDIAIETYHQAMQKAPENGFLLTGLGMAYLRQEDIIPARRYLRKAVHFDPDYYKPRLGLGYIYLQNQQFSQAETQLEASLQLLPTLEGTFLLGEAEEGLGNFPRARQLYQTVIQADKNGKIGTAAKNSLRSLPK